MVTDRNKNSDKTPVKQGPEKVSSEPNKINASTPYHFSGKNLTPYGGLLPVITMLENLGYQALVEQTVTSKRIPRAMDLYRFVLGIVLGLYIGFPRLNQLGSVAKTEGWRFDTLERCPSPRLNHSNGATIPAT